MFHYHVSGKRKLDELVSAFLSALGAMALEVGNEQITVISFAANKFVWVKKGDLYFIALVSQHDSAEIYRVILQDLAGNFVSTYYSELRQEYPDLKKFSSFSATVETTLQKFSGIPGLARRYKTALLPVAELSSIKDCLDRIEEDPGILRGAVITDDEYILLSNLRAYELEDVFDFLESQSREKPEAETGSILSHPGLEKGTSFFVVGVPGRAICAFVVKSDETDADLANTAKGLVDRIRRLSFEGLKKVTPSKTEAPMAFYDYDVPVPLRPISEILNDLLALYPEVEEALLARLKQVLGKIGGETTISEIHEITGFSRAQVDETIAHLIAKGAVKVMRLYPKLGEKDKRFAAFLEVVGISTRDYKVLDIIWSHCTGELSIKEISRITGISVSKILDVLRELGAQVTFNKKAGA
ncbi:MAG: hypothetical protein EAX95_13210 [Candidatus Thorarchaeota archaeon]|nr:hypothetical protein [Candidatus Thorarchaeota archaeon]